MTAFVTYPGQFEPYAINLTGTSEVVIETATTAIQYQLESLLVAASGSSTFRFWLEKADGTEVNIVPSTALVAEDTIKVENHPLRINRDESFRCIAGTGNMLSVTVTLLMISKQPEKQAAL